MSWTDERIELLQKLWLQGMSASKIAGELANGLTRNAVIGKVYRLGLSGRANSDATPNARQTPRLSARAQGGRPGSHGPRSQAGPSQIARSQASHGASFVRGNIALAVQPVAFETATPAPATATAHEVVVPIVEPVTILELRDTMCRWPIGDPTQSDFRYCGARRTPGEGPYCGCHAAIAYQPHPDRRRQRPQRAG
jgi:GcrA cell cycle regulator